MAFRTPTIFNRTVNIVDDSSTPIILDSENWFMWLESAHSFAYVDQGVRLTVRKQGQQQHKYWYGYLKYKGHVYCIYIGKTSSLTLARLQQVVEILRHRIGIGVPETVLSLHESDSGQTIELEHLHAQLADLQSLLSASRRPSRHLVQMVLEHTKLVLRSLDGKRIPAFQQIVQQKGDSFTILEG